MGTLSAIYVRPTQPAQGAGLLANHPTAYTEPGLEFYAIEQPSTVFNPPEDELAKLSACLGTDVLWIGFQSAADAFQFHHWRAGTRLRALIHGCVEQGIWERVEGEPEPWERNALSDPHEAELKVGSTAPSVDAREAARAVAEYYRLPGWS